MAVKKPGRPKGDPKKNKITQAARFEPASKKRIDAFAKRVSTAKNKVAASDVMREGVETFVEAEVLFRRRRGENTYPTNLKQLILRAVEDWCSA